MKKLLLLVLAVVFLAVTPFSTFAQTSYGTVSGSVTDATGASVPNATVTLTLKATGETHTVKSSSNGGFHIDSLGTGSYTVTVEAVGFSKEVINGLDVSPSVVTSLTPTLKVGATTDTVEVSSSSEILKTESGEVSGTLNTTEINDLPLSSLNPYGLVTTLPGVFTITEVGLTNGNRFTTNGSRPRENNYLIEGQDNNDAGIAGQGLQPENEEAVDSVTFLLNSNPAEFGRGGGAIANLVYKSGTNSYHGAVWDRILNSSLNAVDHSTTFLHPGGAGYAFKGKSRENIYGFRVGGPILKNKLFIFASNQFDHYRASAILGTLVLPLATPSASGFCGQNFQSLNTYKSLPNVATLLSAYAGLASPSTVSCTLNPTTGVSTVTSTDVNYRAISLGPDPVTGADRGLIQFGTFQRSLGNIQNGSEFVTKGDYIISEKDKLQLRLVRSPFTTPFDVGNFPSQLPNLETDQHGISYNAGIVETHSFSPSILNEIRISYGRIGFSFDLTPGTYANPLLGPTVGISSVTGFGIPTNTPQGRFHNTYQLQDSLTIVRGNHSMKMGMDVAQVRVRDQVPFLFYGTQSYISSLAVSASGGNPAVPAYTGLANFADNFSGNSGANSTSASKAFGSPLARPTLTNQGYYFQDHWKIKSNLALDLGMRYEYYGAPFNYIAFPAIDPANIGCFQCRVVAKPNFKNFGPRFGFAYTPFTAAKTVLRGGIGVFYDNVFTNVADNIQASSPNATTPAAFNSSVGRGTANWNAVIPTLSPVPSALNTVTSLVPNLRNPYTIQYNVAIEQALPYAMSLTASYVGNRGVHLYGLDFLNPTLPGTTTRVNTTRGQVSVHDNTGDSEYSGGTLELERKYRSGADVRVVYTYAKGLDDVSEEYTSGNQSAYPEVQQPFSTVRGRDWGPTAYDHRQRAVLSTVYNVPRFHGDSLAMKLTNDVVSGIGISAIIAFQTGSVVNVQSGFDINGDGVSNDRPVLENPNAPFGSFAVKASDFYSAAGQNPLSGQYCDGTYINNSTVKSTAFPNGGSFCRPVNLSDVHYYLGDKNVQNNSIRRNDLYTPGAFSNDFTAAKTFKTFEHQDFLFRAECFNCMNHANTGIPAAILDTATNTPASVGTTTFISYAPTAAGGRTLRFFVRYEF
jgi:hypothetical protein